MSASATVRGGIGAQIRNGVTHAQLATFPDGTITLDSTETPPRSPSARNPGYQRGIKDDLASIIGKPVIIPIYGRA